jgi:poly(3-hydroxybutyrate) depolymerase
MSINLGANHPSVVLNLKNGCFQTPCLSATSVGPDIQQKSIVVNGYTRYYLAINFRKPIASNTVLLCFPGGSETMYDFINYTGFAAMNNYILVFQGQPCGNTFSWQNAFPWLLKTGYQHDVKFIDSVLDIYFNTINPSLFLTGKSDGAGFAILYSHLSRYKPYMNGIGVCSSALYGVNSAANIGLYNSKNVYETARDHVRIPYNIIVPKSDIPLFIIHGTGDTVMPFTGQNYLDATAYADRQNGPFYTLWKSVDPSLNGPPSVPSVVSNTYTANIATYISDSVALNALAVHSEYVGTGYSATAYLSPNDVMNFITIQKQNHCWSGHTNSGPDSGGKSNLLLDATYLFALFFRMDLGTYVPTVTTIPPELLTFDHRLITA